MEEEFDDIEAMSLVQKGESNTQGSLYIGTLSEAQYVDDLKANHVGAVLSLTFGSHYSWNFKSKIGICKS